VKLNIKSFNKYTVLSILSILAGLFHYIYWGTRYEIWYDIGIYSITIVLILPGLIGVILFLMSKKQKQEI